MKISLNITALEHSIRAVLARFPFVMAMALGCLMIGIEVIHFHTSFDKELVNLLMTLTLGFYAYISVVLIAEQKKWQRSKQFAVEIGLLAALVGYFFLLPDFTSDNFLFAPFFRHWLWLTGCLLLICFAPFIGRPKIKVLKTWEFNHQVFKSLIRTIFYGVCLFAGLAIAAWAIDTLLFSIADETYGDIWLGVVTIFGPLFFLDGIPTKAYDLIVPKKYPKEAKIFSQFILLPLVTIYFAILYLYSLKIVATWEWPEGLISWMIIWFSFLGVLTYFFLYPLRGKKNWVDRFEKIFWWALIPQVGMLFTAVWIRISHYGITENRYLVVCFGVYLLGLALYFLFSKRKNLLVIPSVLSAIVILSSFGPWGALAVSEQSQWNRLEGLLTQNNMYEVDAVKPATKEISKEDSREILEVIKYLHERHNSDRFKSVLKNTGIKTEENFYQFRAELAEALNIQNVSVKTGILNKHFYFSEKYDQQRVINIDNSYDYLIEVRSWGDESSIEFGENYIAVIAKDRSTITIKTKTGEALITLDLKQKLAKALQDIGWDKGTFEKSPITLVAENEQIALSFKIKHVGVEKEEDVVSSINNLEGFLFVKIKN